MKYLFVPVLLLSSYASALDFEGTTYVPVEIKAEASTGLDAIYVVADTHGVTMVYTAASASSTVKWSRYSRMGAAYSEELSPKREGNKLSIACDADDMGYVIEENGRSRYYWIINYAGHQLNLHSVSILPEQDCDRTHLGFSGSASELDAYSPLGRHISVGKMR